MADSLVNAGNRLYCLMILGRYTTALAYAEELVARWAKLPGSSAYMWAIDGPARAVHVDVGVYVLNLIEQITKLAGDEAVQASWLNTVNGLRDAPTD